MDVKILIIDDNQKLQEDSLIWSLQDRFGEANVFFFNRSQEGLDFLIKNISCNFIVLLDIDFTENEKNGHDILKEINSISKLIPVILWSGVDENKETFSDLINNHAFGFISKTVTSEEAMQMIEDAVLKISYSLDNVLEDWIIRKEQDKNKVIYVSAEGKSYTLNDIIVEIRLQTKVGKSFSKKLNSLTIDLLLRNKEKI